MRRRGTSGRGSCWGPLAAVLAAIVFAHGPAIAQSATEESVKASFLYRFGSFIQWPDASFSSPEAPLAICVTDADPMGAALEQAAAGQRAGERAIVVRRVTIANAAAECHVLYVSGSSQRVVTEALQAMSGKPVLTVTSEGSGADARGIIHFVVIDRKLRFHVDDAQAAASHLTVSSRLLALAISVRRRPVE